jgi:hypothetical protein
MPCTKTWIVSSSVELVELMLDMLDVRRIVLWVRLELCSACACRNVVVGSRWCAIGVLLPLYVGVRRKTKDCV